MRGLDALSARVGTLQLLITLSLVPVFWFPWRLPLVTLASLPIIPLLWWWYGRVSRRLTAQTGIEGPLLCLLVATCIAAFPVFDKELAVPKLLGSAMSAAVIVAIGNSIRTRAAIEWFCFFTACGALALGTLALISVEWAPGKNEAARALFSHVPMLVRGVVPATSRGGINPNEVAGALVQLVPVLACWAATGPRSLGWKRWCVQLVACATCVALLVATGSRGAFAGVGLATIILASVWSVRVLRAKPWPRATRAIWALLYTMACLTLVGLGVRAMNEWVTVPQSGTDLNSFAARREIWTATLAMVRDFTLTGIGIGQFNPVLKLLYGGTFVQGVDYVPHAHNLLLAYAVELGISGGVAFVLVVLSCARACLRAYSSADPVVHSTGLGLLLGLIGFIVFGLTDAIAPGARGSLVMWILFGLGLAAGSVANNATPQSAEPVMPSRTEPMRPVETVQAR